MANTVINFSATSNGEKLSLDSPPVFADSQGFFGIKRTDTGQTLVTAETEFNEIDTGQYQYTFEDPSGVEEYKVSIRAIDDGETRYYTRNILPGTTNFNLSTVSTDYYSSETEVLRIMGQFGVDLIMEDQSSTAYVWQEVLGYVDEIIDQYVGQHYNPSTLKRNKYIRRRATILAAHYLSQRRGNPALYMREAASIREELDSIRAGKLHIPNSVPRGNLGPVVRNYVMQPSRTLPQRVQAYKSTGNSYSGEKISYEPYLFIF